MYITPSVFEMIILPGRTIFKNLNKCFYFILALIFNSNTTTYIKKHTFLTKMHFVVQVLIYLLMALKKCNHIKSYGIKTKTKHACMIT